MVHPEKKTNNKKIKNEKINLFFVICFIFFIIREGRYFFIRPSLFYYSVNSEFIVPEHCPAYPSIPEEKLGGKLSPVIVPEPP